MVRYKNTAVVDFPPSEVFKIFRNVAKRDFLGFKEKSAKGTSVERQVGAYSIKSGKMRIEITEYKVNEVYEITSCQSKAVYKSRYEFYEEAENKTKLVLIETQDAPGALNMINAVIAAIFFKGRVRKRFGFFVKGLQQQLEMI